MNWVAVAAVGWSPSMPHTMVVPPVCSRPRDRAALLKLAVGPLNTARRHHSPVCIERSSTYLPDVMLASEPGSCGS
jgi:hypothetical protein